MAEFMSYDPWKNITSRNGIPGDELVSALQKSIRRGKEEIAVDVAYEMYITSEQFEDKMWRRLMAMAVEDVGFGDTNWRDVFSILHKGGYEGDICVEGYHDPVYSREWEMTGQLHALNYLKWCRGDVYTPNPWTVGF